ncbi:MULTISPECIES: hypothetical protein [Acinetobacter]|uniref:Uncharacterized protein n=1 Tax=Acinetobacter lanii TaxID=2715163 RepID=A0A6G8S4H7_9GAMM|nr:MULTISPECIES: hypothetical protein [Acinetobacter]NHB58287.1 hypothetical protein [Acinetobacter shaoyimingii]QIO08873.1 hypothetical protein G8D99_07485 [Acinetobacter lanii]
MEGVWIPKHTQFFALHKHGPSDNPLENNTPNFFAKKSQMNKYPSAVSYNDAVQVAHSGNYKGEKRPMRTEMHKFVSKKGFCVARSKALANSHISSGGAEQFYVRDVDKNKLKPTGKLFNLD